MRIEEKWEKTRRGKQRTRYPRDVARCDVGEMSFLEDGRERVWNRTKKPAGAEALSRWKKTSVTAPAASTTYSFFFSSISSSTSSTSSSRVLFVPFFSTSSYCRLFIFPPFSPTSWPPTALLFLHNAVRVFLLYFSFCYSLVSFIFFSVRYFILLFFPLFSFLFFFFFLDHSILFLPSFISTFDFFSYQQARIPSIRASPRFSLLILLYVSRLLNQDARSRCLHNNFPNKAEVVFGIWNGVLWYARGSRINCYGIYVILINV